MMDTGGPVSPIKLPCPEPAGTIGSPSQQVWFVICSSYLIGATFQDLNLVKNEAIHPDPLFPNNMEIGQ